MPNWSLSTALACVAAAALLAAPAFAELEAGSEAPDFTLKNHLGEDVKLSQFRDQSHVLLAFFPKAFTPGCTREMKCLKKEQRLVEAQGVTVLAISGDAVETQARFAKTLGLRFQVLADPDLAVTKKYGVFVPTAGGGYASRAVVLIDKAGKVRHMNGSFPVPRTLEGTELMAAIRGLDSGEADPLEGLDKLPSPEREGKTVLVKYVQAVLREDPRAMAAVLHEKYGARAGQTEGMQVTARRAELQRYRDLFKEHEIKENLKFADVVDVAKAQVLSGEGAAPVARSALTDDKQTLEKLMVDGDALVVCRTSAPKVGEFTVFPRELILVARAGAGGWKLIAIGSR